MIRCLECPVRDYCVVRREHPQLVRKRRFLFKEWAFVLKEDCYDECPLYKLLPKKK